MVPFTHARRPVMMMMMMMIVSVYVRAYRTRARSVNCIERESNGERAVCYFSIKKSSNFAAQRHYHLIGE